VTISSPKSEINLERWFPFDLDPFQLDAIAALDAGKSVVVCAPTGSGKTLIGEYAIRRALAANEARPDEDAPIHRVFYTTPLKALSNQKLRDFREQFGDENVGLLTGDISINRDAPILVMTTEIFRNMLYGTPIGQVGTSVEGVDAVVLDECHYMNDSQRGTVWEESIIYCPPNIQLVALSATIENSGQLTDWISEVHGPTELIYSDYRPVPLEFHFCDTNRMVKLLNDQSTAINPALKRRKSRRNRSGERTRRPDAPTVASVVLRLADADMLPAIFFIFSRRGCDRAVKDMGNISLVTPVEAQEIERRVKDFLERNPEAQRESQMDALHRGIAAHHAGILPAWKVLVEELFQAGLIRVVFATETLAAGINMPARTTVISGLSKRTDNGHRLLNASEFLQMAGRAGRRGMDVRGHVVTVQTRFEGAEEAAQLATASPDPLVSQFTPSYGMVLNLLQIHTLEESRELIERSFGQYLATLHLKPQYQGIRDIEAELERQQSQLGAVDEEAMLEFEKLNGWLKEERRLLKILQQQSMDIQSKDLLTALPFAIAGTILTLKGKNIPVSDPMPSVLIAKTHGSGQSPYLVCLSRDNRWHVVTVHDVVSLHAEIPRLVEADTLEAPGEMPLKPGQTRSGTPETEAIALQIPAIDPVEEMAPEVREQLQKVEELEQRVAEHPVNQQGGSQFLKRYHRVQRLQDELGDRQTKLKKHTQRYWQEFLKLVEILKEFDCLQEPNENGRILPTERGEIAAAIRGDNELWLGLALESGELDHLEPAQFAAVCAALSTEVSRPDVWTDYELSPQVEEALEGLQPIRRRLNRLQMQYQVTVPVWMEYDFVALVERWVDSANDELLELDEEVAAAALAGTEFEDRRSSPSPDSPISDISAQGEPAQDEPAQDEFEAEEAEEAEEELNEKDGDQDEPEEEWSEEDLAILRTDAKIWRELCASTSLDDGDIVRVLRRTLDFLAQIPHVPHLPHKLKGTAIAAIRDINRFPVSETNK